ncbi:MAG: TIM barrel protein [Verrucomicrobia bacterium]|nr:TIM barrel protein [Verrucomicrobiota bacterium]
MNRRAFIATLPALGLARSLLAASNSPGSRIGICTFSCHQHWKAVASKQENVKFNDALSFLRYARELGAQGVQTALRSKDAVAAKQIRSLTEQTNGYYEGELSLPKNRSDLAGFETDVRLTREAGATVARGVLSNGRRYEVFKTLEDFHSFQAQAKQTLQLVEPVLRRHRLKLAIENHKDYTTDELLDLMAKIGSEWIGVLVDTGNNMALLEEPHGVIEKLAPFALSVHLKDMAVQPCADGFLLSEVPLGTGMLDLTRIVHALLRANRSIVFNLEMATRDPLTVPCLTPGYWASFGADRKTAYLDAMMQRVKANPPRGPIPQMTGKPVAQQLAEEETNNRQGLAWMQKHIHS